MALLIKSGIEISDQFQEIGGWRDDLLRQVFDVSDDIFCYGYQGDPRLSLTLCEGEVPIGQILICNWKDFFIDSYKGIQKYKNDNKVQKYLEILITIRQFYQKLQKELKISGIVKVAQLSYLMILKDYRNRGLARVLLNMTFGYLKNLGYQAVIFSTTLPRETNLRFQERKSFYWREQWGLDFNLKTVIYIHYL